MNPALQPFLTVALPIMVTILAADLWFAHADRRSRSNRRLDEVNGRLDRIERKLDNHEERIVRVEERTSILHR
jgi:hypothetical protein